MKRIVILVAFAAAASSCTAREWNVPKPEPEAGKHRHLVGSVAEITALGSVSAGDTIVLRSGEWKDAVIKLTLNGTVQKPIVVMAEQAGKTIFTGASKFAFAGEYIVVEGFWWRDITVSGGEIVAFRTAAGKYANHSVLRNCAITGFGLAESLTDYKWVSLYGQDNEVLGCSFLDKRNMGTTLVVWLDSGVEARHLIKGNLFTRPVTILDGDGKSINGQETIRIGTSEVSMTAARCTVEGNYFYQCNGETEIISNKSCFNIYRSNVFEESIGCLTLRHGNDCLVEGNAVFGGGVAGTGGIRIIGFRHHVRDNYIRDTRGSGFTSAICLVQGEENSPLNGYFEATECIVERNRIIECANGITVNYGNSRHSVPIKNNTIANNVIFTTVGSYYIFTVQATPNPEVGTTYSGNIYQGGKFKGCTASQVGALSGTVGSTAPPTGLPTKQSCGAKFSVSGQ